MDSIDGTGLPTQPQQQTPQAPRKWSEIELESSIYSLEPQDRIGLFDQWAKQAQDYQLKAGGFDNPENFQKFKIKEIQTRRRLLSPMGDDPDPAVVQQDYKAYIDMIGEEQKRQAAKKPDQKVYQEVLDGKRNAAFVGGQMIFNPKVTRDPVLYRQALAETDAPSDIKVIYAGRREDEDKRASITRRDELASKIVTPQIAERVVSAVQEGTEILGVDVGSPQDAGIRKDVNGIWSVADPNYVDWDKGIVSGVMSKVLPGAAAQYKPMKELNEFQKKYGLSDDEMKADYMEALKRSAPTSVSRWVTNADSLEDYVPVLSSKVRVLDPDIKPRIFVPNADLAFDKEAYDAVVDSAKAPEEAKTLAKESRTQIAKSLALPTYNLLLNNRDDFMPYAEKVKSKDDMVDAVSKYYKDKKDQSWYEDLNEFVGQAGGGLDTGVRRFYNLRNVIPAMFGDVEAAENAAAIERDLSDENRVREMVSSRMGMPTAFKLTRDIAAIAPDLAAQFAISMLTGGVGTSVAAASIASRTGLKYAAARAALGAAMTGAKQPALRGLVAKIPGVAAGSVDNVATAAIDAAKQLTTKNPLKGGLGTQQLVSGATAGLASMSGTFAEVYSSLRDEGMPPEQALDKARNSAAVAAAITSAITYGFSAFGRGGAEDAATTQMRQSGQFTVRDLVSAGIPELLTTEGGRQAIKKTAVGFLRKPGDEALEEALDQFAGGLAQYVTNPSKEAQDKSMSEIIQESLYAGLLGGIVGGGIASLEQATLTAGGSTAPQIEAEMLGAGAAPPAAPPAPAPAAPTPSPAASAPAVPAPTPPAPTPAPAPTAPPAATVVPPAPTVTTSGPPVTPAVAPSVTPPAPPLAPPPPAPTFRQLAGTSVLVDNEAGSIKIDDDGTVLFDRGPNTPPIILSRNQDELVSSSEFNVRSAFPVELTPSAPTSVRDDGAIVTTSTGTKGAVSIVTDFVSEGETAEGNLFVTVRDRETGSEFELHGDDALVVAIARRNRQQDNDLDAAITAATPPQLLDFNRVLARLLAGKQNLLEVSNDESGQVFSQEKIDAAFEELVSLNTAIQNENLPADIRERLTQTIDNALNELASRRSQSQPGAAAASVGAEAATGAPSRGGAAQTGNVSPAKPAGAETRVSAAVQNATAVAQNLAQNPDTSITAAALQQVANQTPAQPVAAPAPVTPAPTPAVPAVTETKTPSETAPVVPAVEAPAPAAVAQVSAPEAPAPTPEVTPATSAEASSIKYPIVEEDESDIKSDTYGKTIIGTASNASEFDNWLRENGVGDDQLTGQADQGVGVVNYGNEKKFGRKKIQNSAIVYRLQDGTLVAWSYGTKEIFEVPQSELIPNDSYKATIQNVNEKPARLLTPEEFHQREVSVLGGAAKKDDSALLHESELLPSIKTRKDVSAVAVEAYGITLPEGYVKQGDLYVYSPTASPAATTAPAAEPTIVEAPVVEKKERRLAKDQMMVSVAPKTDIPDRVPASLKGKMYEIQIAGANAVIDSMEENGAALNGDGTGVGKTRQIIAVAKYYADKGKVVFIISKNDALGKPFEGNGPYKLGGSMQKDSVDMGVDLTLFGHKQEKAKPGNIYITNYDRIQTDDVPDDSVVIFDEAHEMVNIYGENPGEKPTSQWAVKLRPIIKKSSSVAYYTATSGDKPHQFAYLHKILGFPTADDYFVAMIGNGVEVKKNRVTSSKVMYSIPKGKGGNQFNEWINGLMLQAGTEGRFVKREISYDGTSIQFQDIKGTSEENPWSKYYTDSIEKMDKFERTGVRVSSPDDVKKFSAELTKIGTAIEILENELKSNRKVVMFFSRINEFIAKGSIQLKTPGANDTLPVKLFTLPSPVDLVKEELKKRGIKFTELHGQSTTKASEAQRQFQEGNINVMLASVESGGTGINLDDTKGTEPRSMIFMFAPYRGVSTIQALGRVWRSTTIQNDNNPTRFIFLTATDINADNIRSTVLAKKLQVMNATVGGTAVSMMPLSRIGFTTSMLVGSTLNDDQMLAQLEEPEQKKPSKPTKAPKAPPVNKPAVSDDGSPDPRKTDDLSVSSLTRQAYTPGEARKIGVTRLAAELGITSGGMEAIGEVLGRIARTGRRRHKKIASDLINVLQGTGVQIKLVSVDPMKNGWYDPATNTVFINLDGPHEMGVVETILHELVHAGTESAIRNPATDAQKRLVESLRSQMADARKAAESLIRKKLGKDVDMSNWGRLVDRARMLNDYDFFDVVYGLSSLSEFSTHATTSKAFQQFLSTVEKGGKQMGLFDRFISAIARFFTGKADFATDVYRDIVSLIGAGDKGSVRRPNYDSAALNEYIGMPASTARGVTPEMDAEYLAAVEAGDMEKAQQMVDEAAKAAGYNVGPVYHGAPQKFVVFDSSRIGQSNGRGEGPGFYFTDSKSVAEGYARNDGLFTVMLRMKNPLDYNAKPFTRTKLRKLIKAVAIEEARSNGDEITNGFLANFGDTYGKSIDRVVDDAASTMLNDSAIDQIGGLVGAGVSAADVLAGLRDSLGFDGFVSKGFRGQGAEDAPTIFVVGSSEQIKSADPVTYDDAGNVIPLSQRFQPESPDIRFSTARSTIENVLSLYAPALRITPEPTVTDPMFYDGVSLLTNESLMDGMDEDDIRAAAQRAAVAYNAASEDPLTSQVIQKPGFLLPSGLPDQYRRSVARGLMNAAQYASENGIYPLAFELGTEADAFGATGMMLERELASQARGVSAEMDAEYLAAVEAGDMEKAQAMVDAAAKRAGYLLERFHGTRAKAFEVFKAWSHFGDAAQAKDFWGNPDDKANPTRIMRLYLNISKPYRVTDEEANSWKDLLRKMVADGILTNEQSRAIGDAAKRAGDEARNESGPGRAYADAYNDSAASQVSDLLKLAGFDGIVYSNEYEGQGPQDSHVALSPAQIKSADPVTYDDAGNVIPLSQRFQPESPDIRFSTARGYVRIPGEKVIIDPRRDKILSKFRGRGMLTPEAFEATLVTEQEKRAGQQAARFLANNLNKAIETAFGKGTKNTKGLRVFVIDSKGNVSFTQPFETLKKAQDFATKNGYAQYVIKSPEELINVALGNSEPSLTEKQQELLDEQEEKGITAIKNRIAIEIDKMLRTQNEYIAEAQKAGAPQSRFDEIANDKKIFQETIAQLQARLEAKLKKRREKLEEWMLNRNSRNFKDTQDEARSFLPAKVVEEIVNARDAIDGRSEEIAGIEYLMGDGMMRIIFEANNGIYVTRVYEAFESANRRNYADWLFEAYMAKVEGKTDEKGRPIKYDKLAAERIAPLVRVLTERLIDKRAKDIISDADQRMVDDVWSELVGRKFYKFIDQEAVKEGAKAELLRRRKRNKQLFISSLAQYLASDIDILLDADTMGRASGITPASTPKEMLRAAKKVAADVYNNPEDNLDLLDDSGIDYNRMLIYRLPTKNEATDTARQQYQMAEAARRKGIPDPSGVKWRTGIGNTVYDSFIKALNHDFQKNLDFIIDAPGGKSGSSKSMEDWKKLGDQILMNRKNVPDYMRKFWGEIDNPANRVTQTIIKQSTLLANAAYRENIAKIGLAQGWAVEESEFKSDPAKYYGWRKLVSGDEGYEDNPLKDLYVHPEIYNSLEIRRSPNDPSNGAFKFIGGWVGVALWNATSGLLRGATRNLASLPNWALNSGVMLANPMEFARFWSNFGIAAKAISEHLSTVPKVEGGAEGDPKSIKIVKDSWAWMLQAYGFTGTGARVLGGAGSGLNAVSRFFGRLETKADSKAYQDLYTRAAREGIADNNIERNDMARLLNYEDDLTREPIRKNIDAFFPWGGVASKAQDAFGYIIKTGKATMGNRTEYYSSMDSMTKITLWLTEMESQAKIHAKDDAEFNKWRGEDGMFRELPAELQTKAAQNVNNTVQSDSRVAELVVQFRKSGWGKIMSPFLASRVEFIRTAANAYRIAFDEINNGVNSKEKARGFKRLLSAMTAHFVYASIATAFAVAVMRAVGGGEEDDEEGKTLNATELDGLRKMLPEWANNKVLAARVYKNGDIDWADVSFQLPFGWINEIFISASKGMDKAATDDLVAQTVAVQIVSDFIGNFSSRQIAIEAISNAMSGYDRIRNKEIWEKDDNLAVKIQKGVEYYFKSAGYPGDVRDAIKMYKAAYGVEENGSKYKMDAVLLSMATGQSIRTQKVSEMFLSEMRQAQDHYRVVNRSLYSSALRDANNVDPESVVEDTLLARRRFNEITRDLNQTFAAAVDVLKAGGMPHSKAKKMITDVMKSQEVKLSQTLERAIINNYIPKYRASEITEKKIRSLDKKYSDNRFNAYLDAIRK